jgi:hypothetical protein
VHLAQLLAAALRKQQTYLPLLEALSYYSDRGWTIHVFPWVVGIRGTIDPTHIQPLLKFLGIQQKHWPAAVEKTVLASVSAASAFHFLHTVRFGRLPEDMRPPHDPDHSDDDSVDVMGGYWSNEGPTAPLSGRQKTQTQTPQHPLKQRMGLRNGGALWSIVQYPRCRLPQAPAPTLGIERQ